MTSEERKKILEMVASGRLTVEQADQLMDLFGTKSTTDAEKRPEGQRTGEYTRESMGRIRGYGKVVDKGLRVGELTAREITSLMNHGVDTGYVRALMDLGLPDLTVKQIIDLRNYGVDANYVRALQEAGLADLTVRQAISLYNYGVDADDVRALREDGGAGPTVERLLSLKKDGG
jgi:hypothetical protein